MKGRPIVANLSSVRPHLGVRALPGPRPILFVKSNLKSKRGYVTPKQLKEALAEQVDGDLAHRPHQLLGNIFFEKNMMSLIQVEQVLDDLVMEKVKQKSAVSKKKKI